MFGTIVRVLTAAVMTAGLAAPVWAQPDVSPADLERLQASVTQAGKDIAALRASSPTEARRLQAELDELQDEVIYLRVKLRKERSVPRAEYADLRDRLEDLKGRARGDTGTGAYAVPGGTPRPAPTAGGATADASTVPVGTEIDLRLQTALSSGTAQVEDRFEATTTVDLRRNGTVLIPAGSVVRGVVTDVKSAGRVDRKGSLSLSFDQITIAGRTYPIRGTMTEALEGGGYREDADKIGTGAAVGGIIGGILGGFRGVLTGILIGGGSVVAATDGQQVTLAPGTVLRMRLDTALTVK
ncbi:MAG: hypothetical protein AB1635_07765 [Acidobacteriota bacterium]